MYRAVRRRRVVAWTAHGTLRQAGHARSATMDEWMHLTGGEASYRQHEQRTMRQATRTPGRDNTGRRVRTALAVALVALAARLDPAGALPRRELTRVGA